MSLGSQRSSTYRLLTFTSFFFVQDALDPNGILAPGKQGIWPNRFRHLRETDDAE